MSDKTLRFSVSVFGGLLLLGLALASTGGTSVGDGEVPVAGAGDGLVEGAPRPIFERAVEEQSPPLRGLLRPVQQATLSAPIEAVLMEIRVTEGQAVRRGDVMAVMDNRIAQASVALARVRTERLGAIREAEIALAGADRTLGRLTEAHRRSAAAQRELDDARLERDRANARLQAAAEQAAVDSAELELARQRLERLTIRAPFSGRVVRLLAEEGEMLETATPVLTLVAMGNLEAEIHVPVNMYGQLLVGGTYYLEVSGPIADPLNATLRYISPVVEPSSRTFRCVFDVANPQERIPPGLTVRLRQRSSEPITAAAESIRR